MPSADKKKPKPDIDSDWDRLIEDISRRAQEQAIARYHQRLVDHYNKRIRKIGQQVSSLKQRDEEGHKKEISRLHRRKAGLICQRNRLFALSDASSHTDGTAEEAPKRRKPSR